MCEYQRAKCRDPTLGVVHRGRCKGECARAPTRRDRPEHHTPCVGHSHRRNSECICSFGNLSLYPFHQGIWQGGRVCWKISTFLAFKHCRQGLERCCYLAIAFNFYNSLFFFLERLKMAKHDGWLLNRDSTLTANRCVLFGLLTHLNILKTFETTFKN